MPSLDLPTKEEIGEQKANHPKTKTNLHLVMPPKKTQLSPEDTITGNRFDLVLACQPDAQDNYDLYDSIVDLVENEKDMKIYSPHSDLIRGHTIEATVRYAVTEAIPRTRGVLLHLTTITPEIQKMFNATYQQSRPFLIFYHHDTYPFSLDSAKEIRSLPIFKGELTYETEEDAIEKMRSAIDELIKTK